MADAPEQNTEVLAKLQSLTTQTDAQTLTRLLRAHQHIRSWKFDSAFREVCGILSQDSSNYTAIELLAYLKGIFGGMEPPLRDFTLISLHEYFAAHPEAARVEIADLSPVVGAPPLQMGILPAVSVYGKFAAPISATGEIIKDFVPNCPFDDESPYLLSEAFTEPSVKHDGALMCLTGNWAHNFYHFVFEYLPRLVMASHVGFSGTFLLPDVPYAQQWAKLLGIPERRILLHRGARVDCEVLYAPQFVSGLVLDSYPDLLSEFRQRVIAGVQHRPRQGPRRLYLSRNKLERPRRVTNEAGMVELLTQFGFEVVYPDDHSIEEQVAMARDAEAIIAPHSAALVFTLFMEPGGLVIECFPPDYVNPCVLAAMRSLAHRYHMLPTLINPPGAKLGSDVGVSLEVLKMTLARELSPNPRFSRTKMLVKNQD